MRDLNQIKLTELSTEEKMNVNGGWWIGVVALAIAVLNTDWDKAAEDFKRGYQKK